jgi:hypothetical protein
MKTEEDEAFDELSRKQGMWGGGFQAKRAMAADRFKDGIQWWMDTKTYGAYPNPPQWHIDTGNLVRLVPQRERVVFPTMLRKMWSGGEVQAWLDENVNKEKNA